ncbi:hypothetical protein SBF1_4390003 [Candidatus Desulfosporosinus infrequens]|uniref:Uncharacterized protein n=1 Tax=Candidatus Desulfosporosinus infrequens TaxID=2043169 RepID=A0A2U3LB75_9FIRM|nr:hypothetical protein SBF1_4390003 [Candidatus Desulfosporosinus infrequens]
MSLKVLSHKQGQAYGTLRKRSPDAEVFLNDVYSDLGIIYSWDAIKKSP